MNAEANWEAEIGTTHTHTHRHYIKTCFFLIMSMNDKFLSENQEDQILNKELLALGKRRTEDIKTMCEFFLEIWAHVENYRLTKLVSDLLSVEP